MVDIIPIEQDPEPDIEDPYIRRRSHQPIQQHVSNHHSDNHHPTSIILNHHTLPLPVVTEKDFSRQGSATSTSDHTYTAESEDNKGKEDAHAAAIYATRTPESILGLPVGGGGNHAGVQNVREGNREGVQPGLNRNGSDDKGNSIPSVIAQDGDNDAENAERDDSDSEQVPEITWKASFVNTIKGVPIICLLPILLPVSWALHFTHQSDVVVFVMCLITVIPLAGGIAFATEELALRVGEAWGGLLNATFGNAVELLIAIIALVQGQIDIVQASMIGSILSNLLLVLGCSYFAGGLRFHEQMYAVPNAQMQIGLLGVTLMAIALPSAYHWAYPNTVGVDSIPTGSAPSGQELQDLLVMSRGLSFILLACYALFLTFQLYTHAYLFRVPRERQTHPLPGPVPDSHRVFPKPHWVSTIGSDSDSSSTASSRSTSGRPFRRFRRFSLRSPTETAAEPDVERGEGIMVMDPPAPHAHTHQEANQVRAAAAAGNTETLAGDDEKKVDSPKARFKLPNVPRVGKLKAPREPGAPAPLTRSAVQRLEKEDVDPHAQLPVIKFWYALGMLVVVTALAGVTAEFLVGSIDGMTETSAVSREFVGLILLPVIGNSVEHITAVTVSVKDKLNLSMSIAVGSSIQVSLGILPILVLIGWAIGQPLTLYFDAFETIVLVIAVLLVNFAISDGRTNYLEGFAMMMAYLSIALVCWFYDPIR